MTIEEIYKEWLDECYQYNHSQLLEEFDGARDKLSKHSITANDIEGLVEKLEYYQGNTWFCKSGLFISAMLQESYDAGHNNFSIDLSPIDKKIMNVGSMIEGKPNNAINIKIKGSDIGNQLCGFGSWYCSFAIKGDAGHSLGTLSEYCSFDVDGSAWVRCGEQSKRSKYIISGSVGKKCAYKAQNCEFTIKGDIGGTDDLTGFFGNYAIDCTFIVDKKSIDKKIRLYQACQKYGCKLYANDPNKNLERIYV